MAHLTGLKRLLDSNSNLAMAYYKDCVGVPDGRMLIGQALEFQVTFQERSHVRTC